MNRKGIRLSMVLLFIVLLNSVILSQNKLSVYGFLDVGFQKRFLEENNFFLLSPIASPQPKLFLNHVNLYFDFNPNVHTRSLIEMALHTDQFDRALEAGRSITLSEENEQQLYTGIYNALLMQGADEATARAAAAEAVAQTKAGFSAAAQEFDQGERYGSVKLERAWFEIKHSDLLNFRFGRFLTPAGIWNVDHGSPLILTINQPYQTNQRPIFPRAQDGAMVHGRLFLGDHDMDYKAYLSSGRDDSLLNNIVTAKLKDFGVGGHVGLNLDYVDGISVGISGYTGRQKRQRLMMECNATAQNVIDQSMPLDGFIYTWHVDEVSREYCGGLDAKIKFANIWLQAEYNHLRVENNRRGNAVTPLHAYYVMVAYEATVNRFLGFIPYVFYESYTWKNMQLNPALNNPLLPFEGWTQLNAGVNIRLFTNVRLKLEWGSSFVKVLNKVYDINVDPDSDGFDNLTDSQKYNPAYTNNYEDNGLNTHVISAQVTIAF